MYCSYCGTADQDNAYCSSCGSKLQNSTSDISETIGDSGFVQFAETKLATKSLVWFGISIAWFILWVTGFTMSQIAQQRFIPGLATALLIGLFIPILGSIYGVRALVDSQYSKGLRGQSYLITGGILGLLLNLFMFGSYLVTMATEGS